MVPGSAPLIDRGFLGPSKEAYPPAQRSLVARMIAPDGP